MTMTPRRAPRRVHLSASGGSDRARSAEQDGQNQAQAKITLLVTEPVCRASATIIDDFLPAGLALMSPPRPAVAAVASEPESASIELLGASFDMVDSAT